MPVGAPVPALGRGTVDPTPSAVLGVRAGQHGQLCAAPGGASCHGAGDVADPGARGAHRRARRPARRSKQFDEFFRTQCDRYISILTFILRSIFHLQITAHLRHAPPTSMPGTNFKSDNVTAACPEVMEALLRANADEAANS